MASSRDFTANQIRTAKLILTGTQPGDGGIGVRNIGLAVYDESIASDEQGGASDANLFATAGTDVAIIVSGSGLSRGTNASSGGGVVLFGGDTYISGALVVENSGRLSHGASISGSIHHTATGHTYLKAGFGIGITSGSAFGGQVTIANHCCDDQPDAQFRKNIFVSSKPEGAITSNLPAFNAGATVSYETSGTARIDTTNLPFLTFESGATFPASPAHNSKFNMRVGDATAVAQINGTTETINLTGHFTTSTADRLQLRNASDSNHVVLDFDLVGEGTNPGTAIFRLNNGTDGFCKSDGTKDWQDITVEVDFLITDSNGVNQTLTRTFLVGKERQGERGDPVTRQWDPGGHSLVVNAQSVPASGQISDDGTGSIIYQANVTAGGSTKAGFLGATGTTAAPTTAQTPSADNRFYLDFKNASAAVITQDGTAQTGITVAYSGNASQHSGGDQEIRLSKSSGLSDFAVFKWKQVNDAHGSGVHGVQVFLKSIEPKITSAALSQANEWGNIKVTVPVNVRTNSGQVATGLGMAFTLQKKQSRESLAEKLTGEIGPKPLLLATDGTGTAFDPGIPSATNLAYGAVRSSNSGAALEYTGAATTFDTNTGKFKINFDAIVKTDIIVDKFDMTGEVSSAGLTVTAGGSATSKTLAIKNTANDHTFLTLTTTLGGVFATTLAKIVVTQVDEFATDPTTDNWRSITIKLPFLATDAFGNQSTVFSDFVVEKAPTKRSTVIGSFDPSPKILTTDFGGLRFDGFSGVLAANPFSSVELDGASIDLSSLTPQNNSNSKPVIGVSDTLSSNNTFAIIEPTGANIAVAISPLNTSLATIGNSEIVKTYTAASGQLDLKTGPSGSETTFLKLEFSKQADKLNVYIRAGSSESFTIDGQSEILDGAIKHTSNTGGDLVSTGPQNNGTHFAWKSCTIAFNVKVRDNQGFTHTALAVLTIIKDNKPPAIHVQDEFAQGDNIQNITDTRKVRVGDQIIDKRDLSIVTVTRSMLNNKSTALSSGQRGNTVKLGGSSSGAVYLTTKTDVDAPITFGSVNNSTFTIGLDSTPIVDGNSLVALGGGTGGTLTPTVSSGEVTALSSSPGTGYLAIPTVKTVTPSGGSAAVLHFKGPSSGGLVLPTNGESPVSIGGVKVKGTGYADANAVGIVIQNQSHQAVISSANAGNYLVEAHTKVKLLNNKSNTGGGNIKCALQIVRVPSGTTTEEVLVKGDEVSLTEINSEAVLTVPKTHAILSASDAIRFQVKISKASANDSDLVIPAGHRSVYQLTKL